MLDGTPEQLKRLASVGQPHPHSEIRIVADDGSDCATGVPGEVLAKSETAMRGYWNNPDATAQTLRDGWVHTGDVGYLDDEGYLFLVDRKKDMIISGGENIYSREVEEALARASRRGRGRGDRRARCLLGRIGARPSSCCDRGAHVDAQQIDRPRAQR